MSLGSFLLRRKGVRPLRGKVAVVTGAASGIGRALAFELRGKGCHLALVDRDAAGLERLVGELTSSNSGKATTHVVDVADRVQMRGLAREVVAAHGAVHVLVNNAGIGHEAPFPRTSLDDWDAIVGVNLWGAIHGCHFFLPHLAKAERAHIVNVSSLFGIVAMPGQAAYCTTKFALRGFSESLSEELRGTSIGVTQIHAGAVATNIMHSARGDDAEMMGQLRAWFAKHGIPPKRVARRIVRAIETGAPRVLITPEAVLGDLLKRMMPVAANKLLSDVTVNVIGLGYMRKRRMQQWRTTMLEGETHLADPGD